MLQSRWKIDWSGIGYNCCALLCFTLCFIPMVIHILLFIYLPDIHHFLHQQYGDIWRYHIADSSVTVGLAYYLLMCFLLWKSRWFGWKPSTFFLTCMEEFIFHEFPRSMIKRRSDDHHPDGGSVDVRTLDALGLP